MFKFKIIKYKRIKKKASHSSSKTMGFLQEEKKNLEGIETSTLVITAAAEQDVIGKISLIKKKLSYLDEAIRCLMPTRTLYGGHVWECSILCLAGYQALSHSSSPSMKLSRHFYRTLYDGIVAFGEQNGIRFVVVKLTADAYPPTKDIGMWPYIIEFHPQECPDAFFYGILPLEGSAYKEYQEMWEEVDKG